MSQELRFAAAWATVSPTSWKQLAAVLFLIRFPHRLEDLRGLVGIAGPAFCSDESTEMESGVKNMM